MRVLVIFGLLSLVLAGVGLYGVIAYWVVRRVEEIGVRMALGATRLAIIRLVLRETMSLAAAGLGLGAAGSFVSTRWLASLLYGVTARDPLTTAVTCALIALVALIAASVPAWQALHLDPCIAIRRS